MNENYWLENYGLKIVSSVEIINLQMKENKNEKKLF